MKIAKFVNKKLNEAVKARKVKNNTSAECLCK